MAIHPSFPTSPYEPLNPEYRWFPADETLRESSYEKLLPPLAYKIRLQQKNHFDFVFVDEEDFSKYKPDSFSALVKNFRKYKDE